MADNASITILRNTKANIDAEPIKDGNILFTTDQANNKIYADVGTKRIKIGGDIDVDTELSPTSTNPVQNKVVTNSIDDVRGQIHTNLLNPTAQTETRNGVTLTNNGDGTYTVNGTATATIWFTLKFFDDISILENKKLVGCPVGGTSSTYIMYITCYNDSTSKDYIDYGNGVILSNIPSDANSSRLYILIRNGQTVNNLIFKPMLTTDLSSTYDSFVKYSGSEERLNEQVASLHESSKGIITNLLNPTLPTKTEGGITCTANGDGTYKLNGTSTSQPLFTLCTVSGLSGKHKLVGCPSGGGQSTFNISYRVDDVWSSKYETGNGLVIDCEPAKKYRLELVIRENQTLNNVTFKPMLTTDLNAKYDDYVPYTGDSGRLNEDVAGLFDMFHPIGSLYPTTNASFDPNTAKGWHGTWERITDCVIYAAGTSDTVGQIVGSNTHTLTEAELPSHTHSIPQLSGNLNNDQVDIQYGDGHGSFKTISPSVANLEATYGGSFAAASLQSTGLTTNASTTGSKGSGTAIDMRTRRLNSVVWRRTA
jgi:hypothetical protein